MSSPSISGAGWPGAGAGRRLGHGSRCGHHGRSRSRPGGIGASPQRPIGQDSQDQEPGAKEGEPAHDAEHDPHDGFARVAFVRIASHGGHLVEDFARSSSRKYGNDPGESCHGHFSRLDGLASPFIHYSEVPIHSLAA